MPNHKRCLVIQWPKFEQGLLVIYLWVSYKWRSLLYNLVVPHSSKKPRLDYVSFKLISFLSLLRISRDLAFISVLWYDLGLISTRVAWSRICFAIVIQSNTRRDYQYSLFLSPFFVSFAFTMQSDLLYSTVSIFL